MSRQLPRPDGQPPVVPDLPAQTDTDTATASTTVETDPEAPAVIVDESTGEVIHRSTESREKRNQRYAMGGLFAVLAALLFWMTVKTTGTARYSLSDHFAEKQLPTFTVPGMAVVLACAVVMAICAALTLWGGLPRWASMLTGSAAGLAIVIGFVNWAASGRSLPFQVSNQIAGTLMLATPLILGAMCGVLCERAGVVNVAIEGQMLTGAFVGAIVGSITQSIPAALVAAALAGVLMGALLALFAIKYLVDQVVLGVVINLLAAGLTSFIFNQWVKPKSAELNNVPVMQGIKIPGVEKIPFLGELILKQTILSYIAVISVIVVAVILNRTKWGLRIRSVGEHPRAADTVGINVTAVRWSAVLAGGVFAGLGGAFFVLAFGGFNHNITVGKGFIALAALIMGRWRPLLVALMALFFGFVDQLQSQLQTLQTPMPSDFLKMLPYLATIVAVAGLVGRVRAPAADGVPYVK